MRTILKFGLAVIFLHCIVGCERYKEAVQAAHFSILDSDDACGDSSSHTLELELSMHANSARASITLNGTPLSWEHAPTYLNEVYAARKERFAYLRIDPGVSDSDQKEMFRLMEHLATERLCLLDFKAPHKYMREPGAS